MSPRHTGLILVTLAALGWSLAGLFTRLVTADAWAIVGWRGVFSGIVVAAWVAWREPAGLVRSYLRMGAAGWAVTTISTLGTITYVAALRATSVADVMVIYATGPFVAAATAWLLIREVPPRSTLIAATVALAGVAVMVGGGGFGAGLLGDLLAFGMTLAMALLTVISRRHRTISMIPATGVSAIQLAVIGFVMTAPLAVPAEEIAILAVFGVTQAVSFALYLEGARRLATAESALICAIDVPLGPFWVWLFVSEIPTLATVVGGAVVLAAVLGDIVRAMVQERRRARG
jgi:drug/metabolite transporter (DMT)-like permease